MKRGVLLRTPQEGWARSIYDQLYPGGHAAVFGGYTVPLEAEDVGFEVRDCITVIGPERALVWLLRKPIEEKNVASQVLKTGTGGIFIDGTRVPSDGSHCIASVKGRTGGMVVGSDTRQGAALGMFEPGKGFEPTNHPGGRYPSNLVLVHSGCEREGTRQVTGSSCKAAHVGKGRDGNHTNGIYGAKASKVTTAYVGEDGLETVQNWICAPDCLVFKLDEQSGMVGGGMARRGGRASVGSFQATRPDSRAFATKNTNEVVGYGDPGCASRFFPQFANEEELATWIFTLILGGSPT